MGNYLRVARIAPSLLVGLAFAFPSPAAAQERSQQKCTQERLRQRTDAELHTRIDEWLTTPEKIELSAEQRERVEELEIGFQCGLEELRGGDEMAVVLQSRSLYEKYVKLVRDVVSPEQREAFDRNVRKNLRIGG